MTSQLERISGKRETVKTAIALKNVNFSYSDRAGTLTNINLTIVPGERVGIIGPNGAGKTTLFLSICGILPATGEISLFDKPVIPGEFRSEIGLVFQKNAFYRNKLYVLDQLDNVLPSHKNNNVACCYIRGHWISLPISIFIPMCD